MGLPVLVTVAALGAGYVVLTRQRTTMGQPSPNAPSATPDSTPEVREHGAAPLGEASIHGTLVTGHPEGGGSIDENQGVDPSTSPSNPENAGGGITGDGFRRPSTPLDASPESHAIFVYGSAAVREAGVTRYQMARALAENGPAMGEVW